MTTRTARAVLVSGAIVAACAAGCASTSAGSGTGSGGPGASAARVFDDQAAATVRCMAHQKAAPTSAYRPGTAANTAELLTMMRYYTTNGPRAYCDGRSPTAVDRQWLRLYVAAAGTSTHVARWLPALGAS